MNFLKNCSDLAFFGLSLVVEEEWDIIQLVWFLVGEIVHGF
jgi:hypothetical protein